jgi:CIC family chloride channel protein
MCACLGAVVRAPVTGILIVFEMTHEFALVPALMIGGLISEMISRKLSHESFYETVLAQDGQHVERIVPPRSLRNWMELPSARIANFTPVIYSDTGPDGLAALLKHSSHERVPVVKDGRLAGVITRREGLAASNSTREPALEKAVTCLPTTPVREVADQIVNSPSGLIVLLDKPEGGVIGVITMHDLLRAQMAFARDQQD